MGKGQEEINYWNTKKDEACAWKKFVEEELCYALKDV